MKKLIACLESLGYSSQHPFILAAKKNKTDCLDEEDEFGLTPLQRAIQLQNHKAIKFFSSLTERLNDYEYAYLIMDCDNNAELIKELAIANHRELIHCIQALYPNIDDEGECFGIGFMAQQAFTLGQLDIFYQRLANIKYNVWPIVEDAINEVTANYGLIPGSSEFSKELSQIVQPQFPYAIWQDLYAFFDGVILSQHPELYYELFQQKKVVQEDLAAEPIIRPVFYDNKILNSSSYELNHDTLGIYNREQLNLYFNYLQQILPLTKPLTFAISIGEHGFNIGYSAGRFTFLDANFLIQGKKSVTSYELVEILLTCYPEPLSFFAQIMISLETPKDELKQFERELTNLKQAPHWIALHYVTEEQILKKNVTGYSLLHFAAQFGKDELLKNYIRQLANKQEALDCLAMDDITPLYMAAEKGDANIVKILLNSLRKNFIALTSV